MSLLLGPFSGLISQFNHIYLHYKQQGKAPVFFMTLTGVVALVCSFGYLLQYSFNELLGPISKVALGFIIAIAITVGGVLFSRKTTVMAEYGSSLIALGIILNYLCAYFAGPYYDLLPQTLGFLLLIAVSAMAYVLSLLFATRVVAIITLIGGAAMPLIMQHVDQYPAAYLGYLWVLSMAMLHLSNRIHWPPLAMISMIISALMIEYSVFNRAISPSIPFDLIVILHGFFYGFAWYLIKSIKPPLGMNKTSIIMISSNLLFFLWVLPQIIDSSEQLGWIYGLNIIPCLMCFLWKRPLTVIEPANEEARSVQVISLLYAGLFAAVAALMLLTQEMYGIIWAVEGLILIYLGIRFQFTSVRVEGYIAFVISLISMLIQVFTWVANSVVAAPEILSLSFSAGWGNLIAITAFLLIAVQLLTRCSTSLCQNEKRLVEILHNSFGLFLSLSFLLTIAIFSAQLMWICVVFPMFGLIYYSQKKQLIISEFIGLTHLLLLAVPMIVSASIVNNFHFSEQSIYAQIARIEAFVCLWLVAEFYKRYCKKSRLLELSEKCRQLFYVIIPIFFLPSILRKYIEYLPLVLWASSAISLFLFYRLQYAVLKVELRLLVTVASIVAVYACYLQKFEHWQGLASPALLLGMAAYIFMLWLGQGLNRQAIGSSVQQLCHQALKPLLVGGVYYWGISLFILFYGISGEPGLGLMIAAVYFSAIFSYRPVFVPVRSNLKWIYSVLFILFSVLTLMHLVTAVSSSSQSLWMGLYNIVAMAGVAVLVYRYTAQSRAVWRKTGRQLLNQWLFHLIAIGAYSALIMQLFSNMQGPVISFALVLHGTILLFQSLQEKMKKIIWLSLFLYVIAAFKIFIWDLQDFSIIQKVVVFMLIGACMLAAAFKYQKMLPQLDVDA
ncbi:MAG: DUF2339 domain-containing protein [Pseudomonadales bacterium]|nr:DUF2339 domain-containing protein [Pseudomonadales bacterium]